MTPPLTISNAEIIEGCSLLTEVINDVTAES